MISEDAKRKTFPSAKDTGNIICESGFSKTALVIQQRQFEVNATYFRQQST
jgi:hypothetical protein